jgi:hypothetical protein
MNGVVGAKMDAAQAPLAAIAKDWLTIQCYIAGRTDFSANSALGAAFIYDVITSLSILENQLFDCLYKRCAAPK